MSLVSPPSFFFSFRSSPLGQFSSRGISCNRPVQTVIDRECWGFVVALISNMESTALGSKSVHPPLFYWTRRPSSLCLVCFVWHNNFPYCLFVYLDIFFLDRCLSNAFLFLCFSLSAEQVEDRGLRTREGKREQWRVSVVGLLIERLTDQTGMADVRNESAPRHTPSKPCGVPNQTRGTEHSTLRDK